MSATPPRLVVLDSFAIDQGEPEAAWGELAALGELVVHAQTEPQEIAARCAGALAVFSNKLARAAGLAVTNVPGYATESVAELVFALILHFSHDVAGHNAAVKVGVWAASSDFCFFRQPLIELAGKTLVVVGAGAIGGAVARIGEAFGMEVVRAAVPGAPVRPGAPRTPLAEAWPRADFISLHCPLTEATRGLVSADFLAALKPGAFLINTGRGGLVDEAALIAALTGGRLGGAGLDVLSVEPPPPNHPLTDPRAPWAGRVVVTPHIGWGTVEARRRLLTETALNLKAFLAGQRRNRIV